MKILVATQKPFAAVAVAGIRDIVEKAGHQLLLLEKYKDSDELIKAVLDVDALIIRSDKITQEIINAAPNLKIIVRAGAGYDNVDLKAATKNNIVVMNTPGQNSNAVAELAIAMMIFMSRNQFTPSTGCEISGKKVGIQAFGHVGRLVGKKASALGMSVMAIDPFIPAAKIVEAGAAPARSIEDLYSSCDFVSIHIPATPETIGSIGYDLITKMPEGACLVNTARKEVIDEASLDEAMAAREDIKYVADIKPEIADQLTEKYGDRVFFTPKKMGAQTAEANINAGLAAAHQVVAFLKDGTNRFQVNK